MQKSYEKTADTLIMFWKIINWNIGDNSIAFLQDFNYVCVKINDNKYMAMLIGIRNWYTIEWNRKVALSHLMVDMVSKVVVSMLFSVTHEWELRSLRRRLKKCWAYSSSDYRKHFAPIFIPLKQCYSDLRKCLNLPELYTSQLQLPQ